LLTPLSLFAVRHRAASHLWDSFRPYVPSRERVWGRDIYPTKIPMLNPLRLSIGNYVNYAICMSIIIAKKLRLDAEVA